MIRDIDKGYKRVIKAILGMRKPVIVTVGIHSAEGGAASKPRKLKKAKKAKSQKKEQGLTVGEIAARNEFGQGQPARSFVAAYPQADAPAIAKETRNLATGVAKGKIQRAQFGELFGLYLVGGMQARIVRGIAPPNAKSTILLKGSSTPLIDTGQLRSSIRHKVRQ